MNVKSMFIGLFLAALTLWGAYFLILPIGNAYAGKGSSDITMICTGVPPFGLTAKATYRLKNNKPYVRAMGKWHAWCKDVPSCALEGKLVRSQFTRGDFSAPDYCRCYHQVFMDFESFAFRASAKCESADNIPSDGTQRRIIEKNCGAQGVNFEMTCDEIK